MINSYLYIRCLGCPFYWFTYHLISIDLQLCIFYSYPDSKMQAITAFKFFVLPIRVQSVFIWRCTNSNMLTAFLYRLVNLKRLFYMFTLSFGENFLSFKVVLIFSKTVHHEQFRSLSKQPLQKTTARGHSILKSQSVLTDVFRYFTLYIIYRYLLFQVRRSLTAFPRLLLLRDLTDYFDLPTCPV